MENGSRKIGLRIFAGFLVAITIIIAVFASGITLPSQEDRTGRLTVLLTDAPVDLESLDITISKLEVHKVAVEEGEDEGWVLLADEGDIPIFDLLLFQEGKVLELASRDIPAGTYNKIRMYVSEAFAYYKPNSGKEDGPVNVPPEKIDVITKFTLEPDGSRSVLIDMEPDWVAMRNYNNLRPVLKATIAEQPPEG
jgi:hypothetical protein